MFSRNFCILKNVFFLNFYFSPNPQDPPPDSEYRYDYGNYDNYGDEYYGEGSEDGNYF